jgi:hypothetical protein
MLSPRVPGLPNVPELPDILSMPNVRAADGYSWPSPNFGSRGLRDRRLDGLREGCVLAAHARAQNVSRLRL